MIQLTTHLLSPLHVLYFLTVVAGLKLTSVAETARAAVTSLGVHLLLDFFSLSRDRDGSVKRTRLRGSDRLVRSATYYSAEGLQTYLGCAPYFAQQRMV
jgi:hypothetical protein